MLLGPPKIINQSINQQNRPKMDSGRAENQSSQPVFFFVEVHTFATTFSSPKCTLFEPLFHPLIACSLRSHEKHPKKFARAPRALFWSKFSEKHPSAAFGPTIRKTKNFSSWFSSSCLLVAARSAAKFSFLSWDFSSETVSERS